MADSTTLWTLEELTHRVEEALDELGLEQASGRVRQIPDGRTIRYYTTLGLLDRPAGVKNRRRLYDERHLRQLLTIKRLQAEGMTLSEVQARLLGVDSERERKTFWRDRPVADLPETGLDRSIESPSGPVAGPSIVGLRLGQGVTVLFEGLGRALKEDEGQRLTEAAAALIEEARRLGLIRDDGEEGR